MNVRRRTIELLLATYLDVRDQVGPSMSGDGSGHGKPGSTPPLRNVYWAEGSYHDLERALASLHEKYPRCYRVVWDHYVCKNELPASSRKHKLREMGMRHLEARMPERVYAPQEITENKSWEPWEVRYARRPRLTTLLFAATI